MTLQPTPHLPAPLAVPSTCKHINHLSNALTNCNTYHCRSQSPQPANYQSLKQRSHQPLINTHRSKGTDRLPSALR
ncbi:hypothetical protein BBBOND_0307910 [Babesia bigemina]|uniref:Uncharacterized protein n=1 Tax=Babesia bigemina TaxID=5866 RepID=A0A061DA93_BABBI|nr:hypothetical protein BBBOND_0307910 [Babesia bigemina]CDR96887.1 hypothetical protein BBBOND_0307910 [Babesia bigemina]|eukprot:XP_012769073.1 hypothetical protein BBBOND_0307910 [Babesia bigemina]